MFTLLGHNAFYTQGWPRIGFSRVPFCLDACSCCLYRAAYYALPLRGGNF